MIAMYTYIQKYIYAYILIDYTPRFLLKLRYHTIIILTRLFSSPLRELHYRNCLFTAMHYGAIPGKGEESILQKQKMAKKGQVLLKDFSRNKWKQIKKCVYIIRKPEKSYTRKTLGIDFPLKTLSVLKVQSGPLPKKC